MANGYNPELVGKIDTRLKQVEDHLFLTEQLPLRIGKAVAGAITKTGIKVTQATLWQIIQINLTNARDRQLYGTYNEGPDCIIYLPDSTGTATLYLGSPTAYGLPFGTTFEKFRQKFTELYVTNAAQSGLYLNLLLTIGDVDIKNYTAQATDIQSQYRPVIASTTTAVNASIVYTSDWYDAVNYGKITILSVSDVASAANGVEIQQSSDGVNADYHSPYAAAAMTIGGTTRYVLAAEVTLVARYVRVVYTNGSSNQSYFRLAARAKVI